MKFARYGLLLIGALLLASCSTHVTQDKNFYILEYYPHTENTNLRLAQPINASLYIADTRIPNTYDRTQIVIRHFGPRITYSENHVWAVNLNDIIPNLIVRRFVQYNIFRQTKREFLDTRPDYEITTKVNNIELYVSEYVREARLNMDFHLSRAGQEGYLVEHYVNREERLLDDNIETFVQEINEILLEETDRFIRKILARFLEDRQLVIPQLTPEQTRFVTRTEALEDSTSGMGMLLMPAISRTSNEPSYKVYDRHGEEYYGIMGTPLPLPSGIYTVRYGSGSANQLLEKTDIQIVPRYKTIIEPDWGCLVVDIMDEKRDFANVRYEVFESETGISFGTEFPAEKELGEQQRIWALKPGLYKITINNEPFNTYRDFTTVYIQPGKLQKVTMVVGTDDEGNPTNLVGAGILDEGEMVGLSDNWRFSNAVHGNVNMNSDNEKDKRNPETTITFNTQFDNKITYDNYPVQYNMKNLIEIGTTKRSDTDFRISTDEFNLKNTFIIYFFKNIGLYGRFDTETHFFQEYFYGSANFNYIKNNTEGVELERASDVERVQVKPPLMPLVLKEGVGINYRVLNTGRSNLNLRVGFGMRQDIYRNVFTLSDQTIRENELDYKVYFEKASDYKKGTEMSLVGNFQLPLNLTYYINADVLVPFDPDESIAVEWENVFNLKLFKYISLDYRLRLRNKKPEVGQEYIVDRHTLFLRITYFLR